MKHFADDHGLHLLGSQVKLEVCHLLPNVALSTRQYLSGHHKSQRSSSGLGWATIVTKKQLNPVTKIPSITPKSDWQSPERISAGKRNPIWCTRIRKSLIPKPKSHFLTLPMVRVVSQGASSADSDSQQPTERGLAACGSAEWCVHLVLAAHRGVHKRPTKRPPAPPQCCPTHRHSAQCRLHTSMVHTSSSIGGTLHMSRTKCAFQDGAAGIQQQHPTSWSVLLPWKENPGRIFKSKRVEDLDACASRSKVRSLLWKTPM